MGINKAIGLSLILVMFVGCTTIRQSEEVAIVLDSSKGRYVPTNNLPEEISQEKFKFSHDLAVLSENIYVDDEKKYSQNMNTACIDSKRKYKLPLPDGWVFTGNHKPVRPNNWYTWHMSGGIEIETWEKEVSPNEFVVAVIFRGTDFKEIADWYSNLRNNLCFI